MIANHVNITSQRVAGVHIFDEDDAEDALSRIEQAGLLPPRVLFAEFGNEPNSTAAKWVAVVCRTNRGKITAARVGQGWEALDGVAAELTKEGSDVLGHVETPANCTEFEVRRAGWQKLGVIVDGPVEDGGVNHDPYMTTVALVIATWPKLRVGDFGDTPAVHGVAAATGFDLATVREEFSGGSRARGL